MSFLSKRRCSVTKDGLLFFKRCIIFQFFKKICFCQRLFSKVHDFHIGLSQTVSFTGSFFNCFSKGCFSHVFFFSNFFKGFLFLHSFLFNKCFFRCFFGFSDVFFFSHARKVFFFLLTVFVVLED